VVLIPQLSGIDLIIRALPGAYTVEFRQLAMEIDEICDWLVTRDLEG
jgi:RNase P protein component